MEEKEEQMTQVLDKIVEWERPPFEDASRVTVKCGVPGCKKQYYDRPRQAIKYLSLHYVYKHPGLVFVDWDGSGRNVRNYKGVRVQTTLAED